MSAQAFVLKLVDMEATRRVASALANVLRQGDAVLLSGPLGAGKSAFARAVLQACGVAGDVPSPTFTLMQRYETPSLVLTHLDLYRIKMPEEVEEIGLDEALADGAVLVEWPEKAMAYMPRGALTLRLDIEGQNVRRVTITPAGDWPQRLEGIFDGFRS